MWIEVKGHRLTGDRFGHLIKLFDSIYVRPPRTSSGPVEVI